MRLSFTHRLCGAVRLLFFAGCSDGPKVVQVNGTLTYKGTPVTNAYIYFLPEKAANLARPTARAASRSTTTGSRMAPSSANTRSGSSRGHHAGQEPGMPGKQPALNKELAGVFEKYNATSSKHQPVEITTDSKDFKLELN